MNDEQIKKVIEDTYDESREKPLSSMAKEFYSKKMRSVVIFVWLWAIIFLAGAVFTGIKFCGYAGDARIIYGALFIVCIHGVGLMKIFAWQMIHTNSIKREIKRLELRIAELSETMKNK